MFTEYKELTDQLRLRFPKLWPSAHYEGKRLIVYVSAYTTEKQIQQVASFIDRTTMVTEFEIERVPF